MTNEFRRTMTFVALTFAICWIMAAVFWFAGEASAQKYGVYFGAVYMAVPALVALGLHIFIYREPFREPLGIVFHVNSWWLVAWLTPLGLACATLGVSLLFPGISFTPDLTGFLERAHLSAAEIETTRKQLAGLPTPPFIGAMLSGLLFGATRNAISAFGEELGWRGFLQRNMAAVGFWRSSALIGAIWGLWHAPLVLQGQNYPTHPVLGVALMIAWCIPLGMIASYFRTRAGSVFASSVFFGTINSTASLAILMIRGGNDVTSGITGIPGILVITAVALALCAFDHDPSGPRKRIES